MTITDAKLKEWRHLAENTTMVSAVGEYTPNEFIELLDEVQRLRHPGLGSGALREALRQATETLRVYTAMIPDQRIELEIKQYDALLSLSSPIEPAPTEMRICEINHLVLHPNQTYRFSVDVNCKECVAYVAARPTPQASSEIREARVAAFNEAIDAINGVRFAFERSGWADALERVIKLRNAAKEQAGNE